MFDFLQNSWVVGIGGGIISGIIVYLFTNWLYKRKDNSKYLEQINRANADIIHALKPYVAEKGLPEKEIVDAIIVSTARKYQVKSEELYSIRIICEELIREIVENAYVSSEKKQEYSLQLKNYLHTLKDEKLRSYLISDIEKEIKVTNIYKETNYRNKIATMISMMLSIMAGALTILAFLFTSDGISIFSEKMSIGEIEVLSFLIVLIPTIVVSINVISSILLSERKKRKKDVESKDNK